MKDKEFDAVQMMRRIRHDLSQRYLENLEAKETDLHQIREQYGIAPPPARTTGQQ
ncbi:hypothetical protein J7M28_12205 [bacterium]|nr:hypothetical protein [bacterium]